MMKLNDIQFMALAKEAKALLRSIELKLERVEQAHKQHVAEKAA
jgi:hypothetical protein